MKRIYIVLAFLLSSALTAHGQNLRLGIKGGLNYSDITGETAKFSDYERSRLLGFNAGILANIGISSLVSVQPELHYSTKGYKIEDERTDNNTTVETEVTHKINYLDFPVLVQLSSGNVYFEAGPQVSFLLNQKYDQYQKTTVGGLLGDNITENRQPTQTNTSGYKPADFGYAVGLGFKAPESPLSLNFRYTAGVASLYEDSNIDNKHSVFQVSLNFWLPFNK